MVKNTGRMKKEEGLHYLAYSLTLDPVEEIKGAIDEVVNTELKNISASAKSGIEAAVDGAPVVYSGNEASYRADSAPLPDNYKDFGGKATNDDEEAEVSYNVNAGWDEAKKECEKQLDNEVKAAALNISYEPVYKDGAARIAAQAYRFVNRFLTFILYDIKAMQI